MSIITPDAPYLPDAHSLEPPGAPHLPEPPLLSVTNLRKRFNLEAGFFAPLGRYVYAVNGVSFSIGANETYGLVGESGCGKTTTARLLVRMYEADSGEIMFHRRGGNTDAARATEENAANGSSAARATERNTANGSVINVRTLKGADFRRYREKVKYIFQDPARSLNPRMTVYEVLTSGARWSLAARGGKAALRDEAAALLEEVGLSPADLDRRPAEFSGGQRQRISIARGLLMRPEILICDEVVSALDVSIQGQILNLLLDLRARRNSAGRQLSFLFIAHDLKVASYFCDRIGVMYRGEIMEEAPATLLRHGGLHPYTQLLFSSVEHTEMEFPEGKLPKDSFRASSPEKLLIPATPPGISGADATQCAFFSRCPYAEDACLTEKPPLREVSPGHFTRCRR